MCSRQGVARRPWLRDVWCKVSQISCTSARPRRPGRPGRLARCGRLRRQTQCWKGVFEIDCILIYTVSILKMFIHSRLCKKHFRLILQKGFIKAVLVTSSQSQKVKFEFQSKFREQYSKLITY